MSRTKSLGSIGSVVGLLTSLVLIGASLFLWLNKQYVVDWIAFREYAPTTEIEQISARTTLTDQGKFYFYSAKPIVANASDFNQYCQRKEANSAILGCYANNRIFVYGVTDAQLSGIKEVTAAHEMLHAVYQRMSDEEKQVVDTLLENEYRKIKDNSELNERMAFYAKHEAGEKYNELHSIIATEYANIDPQLESHYAKYFANRGSVVTLHNSYAKIFANLKVKSGTLLAELKTLGPKIEADTKNHNAAVGALNADIAALKSRVDNKSISSQAEFDRLYNDITRRTNSLRSQSDAIRSDTARYEQIRKEYNEAAASSNELYKSMDSKLAPTPSV